MYALIFSCQAEKSMNSASNYAKLPVDKTLKL
jgi:hypothetical protein